MGDIKKRVIKDVGASSGAGEGNGKKIPKIDEVQASQLELGHNFDPNIDPKRLKQTIANRISAQKTKQKKAQYVANLERQAKSLEIKIGLLRSQIEIEQNHRRALLIERQNMKLLIALLEKDRILKEVEIERTKVEINMEIELQRIQVEALMKMLECHSRAIMQPLSNSNSVLFGLGQRVSTNIDQAQDEQKPKGVKKTTEEPK